MGEIGRLRRREQKRAEEKESEREEKNSCQRVPMKSKEKWISNVCVNLSLTICKNMTSASTFEFLLVIGFWETYIPSTATCVQQ